MIAIAAIVVIGVISTVAGGGNTDDDGDGGAGTTEVNDTDAPDTDAPDTDAPDTDAPDTEPPATEPPETEPPETEPPETEPPPPPADPVIGDTIDIGDGAIARVNSVTPNAPPLSDFITPDPGTTFTRIAVELCAGSEVLPANPLYFSGSLDDNTAADAALGGQAFETFGVAPGGCTGGTIDLTVPDGRTLASVIFTDAIFREVGRWSTASTVPVAGPLAPTQPPVSAGPGEVVTIADGGTAAVRSVTGNAAPRNDFVDVADGNQLVEIDVELCAGSAPLSVNPLYWVVTDASNVSYGAELGGQTLTTIELAAGNCTAGVVVFQMPVASTPAYAVLTDTGFDEIGRWRTA